MNIKVSPHIWFVVIVMTLLLQACGASAPVATVTTTAVPTRTPEPPTPTVTKTPFPSATPRPTQTPNLTATQQFEEWSAEAQSYVDAGYLTSAEGKFYRLDDFSEDWAQLGWYKRFKIYNIQASDLFVSAHFKWSNAHPSASTAGCGLVFAYQENGDHYGVFLDRSIIRFVDMDRSYGRYRRMGSTRGTGQVNFDNPFDKPAEADFTLIVRGNYTYVLVNDEVVGEYTLAQNRNLQGKLGLAILSGTNKDFGTRCEMTNLHLWVPQD